MELAQTDKSNFWSLWSAFGAGHKKYVTLALAIAYALILMALWTPWPGQQVISLFALSWVLLTMGVSFDSGSALGLHWAGFGRSLWVVGAALLVAAGAIILAGQFQTLRMPANFTEFFQRYSGYMIWSFLQEFLLLGFFLLRVERLFPGGRVAIILTGILFAVAHMPNPLLTVLTLFWGCASSYLFLRYRNLYTLALTHAILGICIAVTIPGPVHHDMQVGAGYLTYSPHFSAVK